jgi:hypothetical protein
VPQSTPRARGGRGVGPLEFGTDENIIQPLEDADDLPHVNQAEVQLAATGATLGARTVVALYGDSTGATNDPKCYGGGSYKVGSGAWTRLPVDTFCKSGDDGHEDNAGDPVLVYSKKHGKFVAIFLAGRFEETGPRGCGGGTGSGRVGGLGVWTSSNGITWDRQPCAHIGTVDDRPSGWVDNNSASDFYGRIHVTWNEIFSPNNWTLMSIYSDDGGQSWSDPELVWDSSPRRNVQVTVGPPPESTVFLVAMNENGGGFPDTRRNFLFKSTDGGVSWSQPTAMGAAFEAPGVSACAGGENYWPAMFNVNGDLRWRYQGWGEIGVTSNGDVHYAYTQGGTGSDAGDIVYTKSEDDGASWSQELLKTDGINWQPSLAVNGSFVLVNWYDAQATNGPYSVVARKSTNNGVDWGAEHSVSDSASPVPDQVDPDAATCFAGDYNRPYVDAGLVHLAWTHGRDISGVPQEDIVYDQCNLFTLGNEPCYED